ncbi:prepilin peptidase [Demequina sediminicola]|uniref:prepilin peptidase n=1 Tax=Demequina sediminicola TaxID=1095026 RepID=UPI00078524F7|nr:A24 family peptidase [Demequina sediminicola]
MLPLIVLIAALGLALGSFANVVISRIPAGESVVSPPSACPRCSHPIRARHNIPVVGWLVLKGKCFDCGLPISARYPSIEALMGVLFAVVAWGFGLSWEMGLCLVLVFFTVVLSAIDFDTQRLPDRVVGPFAVNVAVYLLLATVVTGDWAALLGSVAGAAILGLFYFVVWFVYPKGMGFGDVKMSPVIGACLGWFGWAELTVGGFSAFVWGAVVGLTVMAITRRSRKVAIPFGPWMFAGAWTGIVVGPQIAEWYLDSVGL